MISNTAAKIINVFPNRFKVSISKKITDNYLKKYAKITVQQYADLNKIQKPTIFICNHLSNSDGLILSKVLKEINPTFVAGIKLSNNAVTSVGIHVVKTTNIEPNSVDKDGIKNIIRLVKQGESLLIFPEGTRSRVGSMIKAKKGILLIARMTGVPIVPIGLYGTEKLLPINQDGDMSEEKFHHAEVVVRIGEQFTFPEKSKEQDKKTYDEYAMDYVMSKIAQLLPEEYRGVYR